MIDFQSQIENARAELHAKSLADIQSETAFAWAARACAAYALAHAASSQNECFAWTLEAREFEAEALEHAAHADDSGDILRIVRERLNEYR